jgi:hypothetical protein
MTSYLRYKQQIRTAQDADDDIESWITVRGNHIPIKKGQSKEEAVKSFLESKGGNSSAKGSSQKNELSIAYHKDKGHIKEGNPPKGWTKVEGATTAPNGYSWYSNNKSMFGGERESYLYKDKPESSKKWNGTWKTVKVNGLKNTTYTDPDGLNFAVWESSNDPGWKASNRSTEQFNSEEEAFNAASETLKEHKAKYGDFTNKRNKDFMYKVYKKNFPEQEPEMGKGHSAKMHELFSKHYDTLYKHAEKDVQYGDLVKEFDKKLQSDPEFKKEVQEFVRQRGDVLSSDREVKAYMLARNEANKASASTEKPKDVKNTFLSNPNTLKEFANHFGISEKVAKNASEKFGDAFYHVMTKDPQAGAGLATNYEKYTKEDVEKHLEGLKQKTKESKESKQPADIMDWKFEDVMKLPVSDPRVHKYIAKNNWLKTSTVATIAEAFGNTEDLYMEIDRMSNAKGYGWDKIKWGKK